ncbi:MAG: class II D-tagatose-bisphosphate aldolase, non-catalytic subunit [Paracoccaceae bacterium]
MNNILRQTIQKNRAGACIALPSVCSAHPDVLAAALLLAKENDQPLIIEATSNQVNQDGGYTGMRAADFVTFVRQIADKTGFEQSHIIFGGDHLGPQVWRAQPAEIAMEKAKVLVAEYVRAGFTKIHLDCSEGCLGEPAQVDDTTSAARATQLAVICEENAPNPDKISYMVGTEVPPPGGARGADEEIIHPTTPDSAKTTLLTHFAAFDAAGISAAKSRIAALVVQPGVEFSPTHIDHLPKGGNAALRAMLTPYEGVCFEAHSTDYQHPQAYKELAEMGFAIHKVGPALTFAYRQAIYALDGVLNTLQRDTRAVASVADVMENLMQENPDHWAKHYHGDARVLRLLRHYSYADRIRYYWTQPQAETAVLDLLRAIDAADIPEPLWMQFFGAETCARATILLQAGYTPAKSRILAEVQTALAPYFFDYQGKSA